MFAYGSDRFFEVRLHEDAVSSVSVLGTAAE